MELREVTNMSMSWRWLGLGIVVAVTASACAEQSTSQFVDPPADTYSNVKATVVLDDKSESWDAAQVTPAFFAAAKVRPQLGRNFIDGDYQRATISVVVLSYDTWQRRFGAAPEIIGKPLSIDGHPTIVVGVLQSGFSFPNGATLWLPKLVAGGGDQRP
jgi:hypothetical protein